MPLCYVCTLRPFTLKGTLRFLLKLWNIEGFYPPPGPLVLTPQEALSENNWGIVPVR